MNRFLSWKVFMPLGRLCFAAYLINLNFIKVYTANMRTPVYFVESHFLVTCAGFITYIFTLSFLASVLIEMPFLNLDKMLLPNAPRVVQKVHIRFESIKTTGNSFFKSFFVISSIVGRNGESLQTIAEKYGSVSSPVICSTGAFYC